MNSWRLLRTLKPINGMAWLCFGDFNEILHQHEKWGTIMRSYNQMGDFRQVTKDCNLCDLGYLGHKYTWSNN